MNQYNPDEDTEMNYDYSSSSKSASPTWTFSYAITNADPGLNINLYIYSGADGVTWDDETVFDTPPGILRGIAHVSTTATQVNIPNLQKGDFVVVEVTSPTGKSFTSYRASSRAGSAKTSGKIIITS